MQTKDLTIQAMIVASYIALVFIFQMLAFEVIQFRIAEVLLILVFFDKKSLIGIVLGTFLANVFMSPLGPIDWIVGTIATIISLILMLITKKIKLVSLLMPALVNGILVGLMLSYLFDSPFIINFFWVFLGEFAVMFLLGYPLFRFLSKHEGFLNLFNKKIGDV